MSKSLLEALETRNHETVARFLLHECSLVVGDIVSRRDGKTYPTLFFITPDGQYAHELYPDEESQCPVISAKLEYDIQAGRPMVRQKRYNDRGKPITERHLRPGLLYYKTSTPRYTTKEIIKLLAVDNKSGVSSYIDSSSQTENFLSSFHGKFEAIIQSIICPEEIDRILDEWFQVIESIALEMHQEDKRLINAYDIIIENESLALEVLNTFEAMESIEKIEDHVFQNSIINIKPEFVRQFRNKLNTASHIVKRGPIPGFPEFLSFSYDQASQYSYIQFSRISGHEKIKDMLNKKKISDTRWPMMQKFINENSS